MYKKIDTICILMATFNGELYIKEQIESILSQTHSNFILIVRDDDSNDNTLNILRKFEQFDKRIKVLNDNYGNLGVNSNFSELMKNALETKAEYFCFADQDDVWDSLKLEVMLQYMKNLESRIGNAIPLLIYSDLEVVDSNLETIASSFMKYQGLTHSKIDQIGKILVQNTVTGCATLFNRKLLNIGANIPADAIVHDWWLALCASYCGHLDYIPLALVKYRQHGKNQIGAKGIGCRYNPFQKEFWFRLARSRNNAFRVISQASNLFSIKTDFSSIYVYIRLEFFVAIKNSNFVDRLILLKKIKLYRSGFFSTVIINLRFLFLK
jgi:glycosyltransferase involved in cell wall biosynthesis